MNETKQAVCDLIAMACWGAQRDFPAELDWRSVRRELRSQALTALPGGLLQRLPLPDELRRRWERDCLHAAAGQLVLRRTQTQLCMLLRAAGIPFAVVKGSAAARCYPDPLARMPGDIDLLLPPARMEEAVRLLCKNGCEPTSEEDENSELHTAVRCGGVTVELHHSFAKREQRGHETINALLRAALGRAAWVEDAYGAFAMLPAPENGLALLEHIARHLWGGLGLRQIVDWMLYVHAHLDDAAWDGETGGLIRACGLETLAVTATALCAKHLGLPDAPRWAAGADDALVEALFRRVYDSGNFGAKQQRDAAAANVIRAGKHTGPLRVLYQRGIYNWRFAQTHRWARPLAPFYQIGRYTLNLVRGGRALAELSAGYTQTRERDRLLRALRVE